MSTRKMKILADLLEARLIRHGYEVVTQAPQFDETEDYMVEVYKASREDNSFHIQIGSGYLIVGEYDPREYEVTPHATYGGTQYAEAAQKLVELVRDNDPDFQQAMSEIGVSGLASAEQIADDLRRSW